VRTSAEEREPRGLAGVQGKPRNVDKTRSVIDATRQDSIDKTTTVDIDTVE
jgi:hypothetical protein